MAPIITTTDVAPLASGLDGATVETLVAGLNAQASRVAPCLAESADEALLAEAKLVLLGAIKRWIEAGSGAITQQGAGPFQQTIDTRQSPRGYALWPSELSALANLCDDGSGANDQAFMVDMTPATPAGSLWSRPDLWFQWVHPTPHDAP